MTLNSVEKNMQLIVFYLRIYQFLLRPTDLLNLQTAANYKEFALFKVNELNGCFLGPLDEYVATLGYMFDIRSYMTYLKYIYIIRSAATL